MSPPRPAGWTALPLALRAEAPSFALASISRTAAPKEMLVPDSWLMPAGLNRTVLAFIGLAAEPALATPIWLALCSFREKPPAITVAGAATAARVAKRIAFTSALVFLCMVPPFSLARSIRSTDHWPQMPKLLIVQANYLRLSY